MGKENKIFAQKKVCNKNKKLQKIKRKPLKKKGLQQQQKITKRKIKYLHKKGFATRKKITKNKKKTSKVCKNNKKLQKIKRKPLKKRFATTTKNYKKENKIF